jgi:hypothetical protein
MQDQQRTDLRVLEIIVRSPGTALDDIVLECPDLTWNQVFIAIDRLSREGALKLTPKGRGLYTVHLSNDALQAAQHQTFVWIILASQEPIQTEHTDERSIMKAQTSKQTAEKKLPTTPAKQGAEAAAPAKSARPARPSFNDLQARITARAYELYAERGYRTGCAIEDWVDAEREILSHEFPV